MEKKTKQRCIPREIFHLFLDQCIDPIDGSILDQSRVLEAMERGIFAAYEQGFMDGYEKRDTEKFDRFPEY